MSPQRESEKTRASKDYLFPMLVRVPPQLHEDVKARAAAEDLTMAQLVRRAIRQYLEGPVS